MFLVRQAVSDDVPTLLKLARMVHFINLPADKDIISAKVAKSRRSFAGQAKDPDERQFMFVLEDAESGAVVGTSAVISRISRPGWPHVFLRVRRRSCFSEDLQQGAVHTTVQLGTDESGPSEVGGLILAPGYRGHRERLGSLLSLIRLHYVGLHRDQFADRMLAELMGPLSPDSRTLLWDYLGRRFINLSYHEADLFCQHSKEFMTSLWPRDEMYVSILPPEARALIGKVGEETIAAKVMLERQGFRFNGCVDPFDGGPYLEAKTSEIPVVAATRRAAFAGVRDGGPCEAFVSFTSKEHGYRALRTKVVLDGDAVHLPAEAAEALCAAKGNSIGLTPLEGATGERSATRETAASTRSAISDVEEEPLAGPRR